MEGETTYSTMKELRIGRYVLIDGIPCKVVDIDISSPGKHGSAKMRVTAIGIFDGQKKTILKPSDSDVEVPVINKKKAQVVSVEGSSAQVMDLETYEVFTLAIPEDLQGKLKSGNEVELLEAMGNKTISRTVG
ncbi:MAG: translation initiation factor IF-5A [Candidatus Marsarchaeota archaeon]|jgi:translation initiation factor 5A|nr:translation initiation factor IF-5A [Candidatus Marsarchaeota archaeon]MCL5007326.1 translation initiation factor IF-5A [Candidatus Marsarchaeota archaeon]